MWIKTAAATASNDGIHTGAWFGCDFWSIDGGWIDGIAYAARGGVNPQVVSAETTAAWFVPMGSDWTYRYMYFTVPSGNWGTSEPSVSQILGMDVWWGVYCGYTGGSINQEMGEAWFSAPVLYVNPSSIPDVPSSDTVFMDGFESGTLRTSDSPSGAWTGNWTGSSCTSTVDDTYVSNGTYAGKFVSSGATGYADCYKTFGASYTELYYQFYVRFNALPTSEAEMTLLGFLTNVGDNNPILGLGLDYYSGSARFCSVYLKDSSLVALNSTGDVPVVDTWYCVELYANVSATIGEVAVYINGTAITSLSDSSDFDNNDYGSITGVFCGLDFDTDDIPMENVNATSWIDDVIVSTSYVGFTSSSSEEEEEPTVSYTANLYFSAGESFGYQGTDYAIVFTVLTGSLTGSAEITSNSTVGTMVINLTSTGSMQAEPDTSLISVLYNGLALASDICNYSSGGTLTVTWIETTTSYITISPSVSAIAVGGTETFVVNAYDSDNILLGDVTGFATFSISAGAGGSWSNATYTSETAGLWVVTATYSGKSATANLTVVPSTITESIISMVQGPFSNSTLSSSSFSITMDATPTSGDIIVLTYSGFNVKISSITQTNVDWNRAILNDDYNGVIHFSEIWIGEVSASANATLTLTLTGAPSSWGAVAIVYEFANCTATVDNYASSSSVTATVRTGNTLTSTQTNELFVGTIENPVYVLTGLTAGYTSSSAYVSSTGYANTFIYKISIPEAIAGATATMEAATISTGCMIQLKGTYEYNEYTTLQLSFDNESSNSCVDWSGYSNNGVLTSGSRSYYGYYGMGLQFTASNNGYVYVPDSSTINFEYTVMMSAWIYPTTLTDAVIFDKPNQFGLYVYQNGSVGFMINGDIYNSADNSIIKTNSWQHIVGCYDSTAIYIYVNDVLEYYYADVYTTFVSSAFDLIIANNYTGRVDEAIICNYLSVPSTLDDAFSSYPYCYSFDVSSTNSWVTAGLTYNFTGIYIQQNTANALSYMAFSFSDGTSTLGLSYDTTLGYTQTTGGGKILFIAQAVTTTGNGLALYASIEIQDTIQSVSSVSVTMTCLDVDYRQNSLVITGLFSIYGLGGVTTSTLVGDGSQILGGSIFDIMAQNSSLTASGSYCIVSTVIPNFQHVHIATSLYQSAVWDSENGVWDCPTYCAETGYLEYGVSYVDLTTNETVDGWYVHIAIVDGDAGDHNGLDSANAWVQLNCSWYNNGEYVKSDQIYAFYDAYHSNDTTTQIDLNIDLWLSSQNQNSLVGGHVSSTYYGMTETGWWLWSDWGPIYGLQTSSTFYSYLYDSNSNVSVTSNFKYFNVWSKIAKTSEGLGDTSCDNHLWAAQCSSLQFIALPTAATLVGINTPVFNPTTTPNMPVGYFAELANQLAEAINSLTYAISTLTSSASSITASVLDSAFSAAGIPNFLTTISDFTGSLNAEFLSSVGYIKDLIVSFFDLFAGFGIFIIEWFGKTVTIFISIGTTVTGIIDGTGAVTTGLGDIWAMINIGGWIGIVPIAIVIAWMSSLDDRARKMGGGWMGYFMSDIQSIISVLSFILDICWRVVTTAIDLGMRFISMLPFVP